VPPGVANHLPESPDAYQIHFCPVAKVDSSTILAEACFAAGQDEAAEASERLQIMEVALKSLSATQSVASRAVVEAQEGVRIARQEACKIVEREELQMCEAVKKVSENALMEIQNEFNKEAIKLSVLVESLASAQANVMALQGKSDSFFSSSQIAAWEIRTTALGEGYKASPRINAAAAEKTQEELKIAAQQAEEARDAMYKLLIEKSDHGVLTLQEKCESALFDMQAIGESMIRASNPKKTCAKSWERKVTVTAQSIVKMAIGALKKTALAAHELADDSMLFRESGLEGLLSRVALQTDEWEAWDANQDVLLKRNDEACCAAKTQLALRDAKAEVQSGGCLAVSKLQASLEEYDAAHMAKLEACQLGREWKNKANMTLLFAREEAEQAGLKMLVSAEKFSDNEEMEWKDAGEKNEKDLYETARKAATDLLHRLDVRFLSIADQATLACKEAEEALKAARLKELAAQAAFRTAQEGWKTLDEAVKKAVVLAESCIHDAQKIGELAAKEAEETMSRLKSTFSQTVREDAKGWERRAMMLFKAPLNSARRAAEKASTEAERCYAHYAVPAFVAGGLPDDQESYRLNTVLSAVRDAAEWVAQFAGEKTELLKLAGCKAASRSIEQGQKILDAETVRVQATIRSNVTKLEAMLNSQIAAQSKDQEAAEVAYMASRVALAEAELLQAIDCPQMTAACRRAAVKVFNRLAPDFFAPLVQAREDSRGDADEVLGPHDICCKYCFNPYVMDLDHGSCPVLAPCCGARLCKACAVNCASSSNPRCVNWRTGCKVEESKPGLSDYAADKFLVLLWNSAVRLGFGFSGE
jgi:hypothetical protein